MVLSSGNSGRRFSSNDAKSISVEGGRTVRCYAFVTLEKNVTAFYPSSGILSCQASWTDERKEKYGKTRRRGPIDRTTLDTFVFAYNERFSCGDYTSRAKILCAATREISQGCYYIVALRALSTDARNRGNFPRPQLSGQASRRNASILQLSRRCNRALTPKTLGKIYTLRSFARCSLLLPGQLLLSWSGNFYALARNLKMQRYAEYK